MLRSKEERFASSSEYAMRESAPTVEPEGNEQIPKQTTSF